MNTNYWKSFVLIFVFLFLLVINYSNLKAIVFIEKSTGLESITFDEGKTEFEVGDINNDGNLDVVSVGDHGNPQIGQFNGEGYGILTYLGDGAGNWTFTPSNDQLGYGGCALGDMNRDGFLDIALGVHHGDYSGAAEKPLNAFLGNGTGVNWTEWREGLLTGSQYWGMFATDLADFNNDGLLDIVSQSFGGSNGVKVYRNNGDGTWELESDFTSGSVGFILEVGDINGDGYIDLITNRAGKEIFFGNGDFDFTLNSSLPSGTILAKGDFNNSGRDAVILSESGSSLKVYSYNDIDETWESFSTGLETAGSVRAQFGDFNSDSFLDIVSYTEGNDNTEGIVTIHTGDGEGNWTYDTGWDLTEPGIASALRVDGDIDHDGNDDIFTFANYKYVDFIVFYYNDLKCFSPYETPQELDVKFSFPRGNEILRGGGIRKIKWLSSVPSANTNTYVDMEYSLNGDAGPWYTLTSNIPNSGHYEWLIPTGINSNNCKIKITVVSDQGETVETSSIFSIIEPGYTEINDNYELRISNYELKQNYPNPFNPVTKIRYALSVIGDQLAEIVVYNTMGQKVWSSPVMRYGSRVTDFVLFDGSKLNSGIYYYSLVVDGKKMDMKSMVLIK